MPILKDQTKEIINHLAQLNHDQHRVLFGDAKRFRNWLINKGIEDDVSVSLIIIL